MKLTPITRQEAATISIINSFSSLLCEKLRNSDKFEKGSKILYTVKREGKNKGQYGYYHNREVGELYTILRRLNVQAMCDLGSGAGLLLRCLRCCGYDFTLKGYEIESSLVEIATKEYYTETVKKDIFSLKKEDLARFQAIYFWEPFEDPKLAQKFVAHLEKILTKGQYIIYKTAGSIGSYLAKSKIIKDVLLKYRDPYFLGYRIYVIP